MKGHRTTNPAEAGSELDAGRGRLALLFTGIALLFLLGSAIAGGRVYDRHLLRVTGRGDMPWVSCFECHGSKAGRSEARRPSGPRYIDPLALAFSPDGETLYVVASGADQLLEVDPSEGTVRRSIELGGFPRDIDVSADGARIAVTERADDRVAILDAATLEVSERLEVGPEPTGVGFSASGTSLFVAISDLGNLEIRGLDPNDPNEQAEQVGVLRTGEEPMAVALSPDGSVLAIVNQRVTPGPQGSLMASELTLIDAPERRVRERRVLPSAHLGRDVTFTPDGTFALVPIVHFRNQLPITQVRRGAVMNSALVLADVRPGGPTAEFPLDELNAYFADPSGVAVTPDGRIAFVSHGGAGVVTAVDLSVLVDLLQSGDEERLASYADDLGICGTYVLGRVETMDDPGAMVVSPDGTELFVAERLNDTIAVIDVARLEILRRIDLGGPSELTEERLGERVFHDASVTFQGQFSCRSCHPEGNTDSIVWDFEIDGIGKHKLETRSLRGIRDTPPFKWNGKNPDLQTQCGPRFARVLTRSNPFAEQDLEHLVAFIESIPVRSHRSPPETEAARERGRTLFFRSKTTRGETIPVAKRCSTCHRPTLYTNRLMSDVGTGAKFDTPHLLDVAATAPYLHDGRARTLEQIWTLFSPHDEHGVTNDLSKVQLNDLVTFLKSL